MMRNHLRHEIGALCFVHDVLRIGSSSSCILETRSLGHSVATRCLSNILQSRSMVLSSVPKKVSIVGGGLAGLSVAYNLLDLVASSKDDRDAKGMQITIYDKARVGEGGASSVAGG